MTPRTTDDDTPEPLDQEIVLDMGATEWLQERLFAAEIIRPDGSRQYLVLDLDRVVSDTTDPLARAAADRLPSRAAPETPSHPGRLRLRLGGWLRALADHVDRGGER